MRYGRFNLYNQLSYSYFEELHEYTRQALRR